MTDTHTPSQPVRPSGDISPLQLGNAMAQPGGRWTSPDNRIEETILEEIADGTREASHTEVNRIARELIARRRSARRKKAA